MVQALSENSFITVGSNEKDGNYTINVVGEMIGDSADSLIGIVENAFLKTKSLQLILDLRDVTYINSYSFGILSYLWRVVRENGRRLYIVANSAINLKFDRLGFNNKAGLKIISLNKVPQLDMTY